MKHELNSELCELGKRYQGGHISLDKYRTERRAVIDRLSAIEKPVATKKLSKMTIIGLAAGLAFLVTYWIIFKVL